MSDQTTLNAETSLSSSHERAPLWVAIPDSVLFDPELRANDIRVYAVLKRYALRFGDNQVWPNQEHIARNAGCHRSSLSASLALLERRGHISRTDGGFGKANQIAIAPPVSRAWGFDPTPHSPCASKPSRRPQAQVSQSATCGETRHHSSPNPTSVVANSDTIKDVNDSDEKDDDNTFLSEFATTGRPIAGDGEGRREFFDRGKDRLPQPIRPLTPTSTLPSPGSTGEGLGVRENAAHRGTPKEDQQPKPQSPEHAAWAAFCTAANLDLSAATPLERQRSLTIARRLLRDGVTSAEIAACTRYLRSQTWRTAPLSLGIVEMEVGKWRMAGRPAQEAPPPTRPAFRSQADLNAATGKLVV